MAGVLAAQLRDCGGATVVMTATSTPQENTKIMKMCDMKEDTVVIRRSPITENHMFIKLVRPPSIHGFESDPSSVDCLATEDILCRIVLDSYIEDILADRKPKTIMIFVQSFKELNAINRLLLLKLEDHLQGKTKPWAINHSDLGSRTKSELFSRMEAGEISLFITTSVMLCGVDLPCVDIVVILRPFGHLGSFVQAGGRGGRIRSDGMKSLVAVYMLFNATDIRDSAQFVTPPVRAFFRKDICTRQMLHHYFCPELVNQMPPNKDWCCDVCNI